MNITQRDRDLGTAYALREPSIRTELTSVARGSAMGELMRRYWHPVGLATDATDIPRKVRILGEDLVLFRDRRGNPGLLHARCCHRGTTLYYGKVEDDGIRCCYHGWKFDTEGNCLEQPCEPDGGLFKDKVRQPWYPVEERYGLIFAYMGPVDKKPVLPRYDCLETMDEDEFVEADDSSIGGGGPAVIPCNWLQHFENVVDPYHVPVLHGSFSGPQFTNMMASMPEVKFEMSPRGVTVRSIRHQDDGKIFYRVTEAALPTLRVVPNPRVAQFARVESIGWTLPIDDISFRIYVAGRVRNAGDIGRMRSKFNGKFWWDMTEAEHQQFPGDYEAQVGQGAVTIHSEEHFGQSDRGIMMIRRMLKDQLEALAAGRDPIGVSFDPSAAPVQFEAGNFIREAQRPRNKSERPRALGIYAIGTYLGTSKGLCGMAVAKPSMRALSSALVLSATCFGQGVGPLVVGALNDVLQVDFGAQAVRYSLLSTAVTTMLGALLFVVAARWIRDDIKRAT